MASPKQGQGVGPLDPMDVAASQPKMMPCGEREEALAVVTGPVACMAAAASGLRCKAFLVLAVCLAATVLPYSLGTLAALPWVPPASLHPSFSRLDSPASQGGTGDNLVAMHGDPLNKPAMQQCGRVLMGSVGTPGCFPGAEGDMTHGTDAERRSLGTPAAATASTSTALTSPQWQPGSGHREGLRLDTAVAVTFSPTQWLDTGVPATSPQLLQTMRDPSPGSQHYLALGSLPRTGPGLYDATWVPAETLAHDFGQPVGMAEPQSTGWGSEGTPQAQAELAAWGPAASPAQLQPTSLPGTALLKVVPTQLALPEGAAVAAHVPSDAPAQAESAWTLMGTPSQSHSAADQHRGDQMLAPEASTDYWTVLHRADLSLAASSKLPAVVTTSSLSSQARAVTAVQGPSSMPTSDPPTASGFSDVWHGTLVAGATRRTCNGQKEEGRPSPSLSEGEDCTAAHHLVPLPGMPSERTSSLSETHPGTVWVPSAVTSGMLWGTQPADTYLHGEAALLADTVLAKVPEKESGLLVTLLASPPGAASAHGVNHPQVLAPFLPTAESGWSAVTSELSDLSSPAAQQILLTPTTALPSPALTRAPSAVGLTVTGVSLAAPDAIPEPGVTKASCKDGAAMVASPSPRAAGVTHDALLGSPTQKPCLYADLFLSTASEDALTTGQHQTMKVAEMSVLPGQVVVAETGHTEPSTALTGPTAALAGLPGATYASPGSVPPPTSTSPAADHWAVHHTGTTGLPSPSYLLTSTGVVHATTSLLSSQTMAASAGVMSDAQPMSSHSVTSQHPSTAREHLSAAAGEAFTPAELMTKGKLGSPGVKHVLPLQFRLLGIAYTEALSSKSSKSYRELEEEVMLMLNQTLSTYEAFLQANVLEFMNGSVVVRGEVLFRGDAPAPTNSHLIRTIVTEASRGRSIFSWQLEPQSVQSSGFSLENLDPEKLSISFTVLQLGRSRTDSLERLSSEVVQSLSALYLVRNFTIFQLRNHSGNLDITGDIYLDTIVHADVATVLQALTALATYYVDLTSLSMEGARLPLQVYPVSFLITNRHFSNDLLNPFAMEHQELTRDLGDVVASVLRDHKNFLQTMIRGFLPGSLICHGDVVFEHPAPTSLEVLEALVLSVGPNKALAGSDFQVDPYSIAVGEDALEPTLPEPGLPEYGVVIVVMCGLCIITVPIILLVCLRTKRLSWQDVVAIWDRRDPEVGTQTLEMDNQGFWASSEQGPEDAHMHWQNDSA